MELQINYSFINKTNNFYRGDNKSTKSNKTIQMKVVYQPEIILQWKINMLNKSSKNQIKIRINP